MTEAHTKRGKHSLRIKDRFKWWCNHLRNRRLSFFLNPAAALFSTAISVWIGVMTHGSTKIDLVSWSLSLKTDVTRFQCHWFSNSTKSKNIYLLHSPKQLTRERKHVLSTLIMSNDTHSQEFRISLWLVFPGKPETILNSSKCTDENILNVFKFKKEMFSYTVVTWWCIQMETFNTLTLIKISHQQLI